MNKEIVAVIVIEGEIGANGTKCLSNLMDRGCQGSRVHLHQSACLRPSRALGSRHEPETPPSPSNRDMSPWKPEANNSMISSASWLLLVMSWKSDLFKAQWSHALPHLESSADGLQCSYLTNLWGGVHNAGRGG